MKCKHNFEWWTEDLPYLKCNKCKIIVKPITMKKQIELNGINVLISEDNISKLEELIKGMKDKDWPKDGDDVFYVDYEEYDNIGLNEYDQGHNKHVKMKKHNEFYPTEEGVKMKLLRRKGSKIVWKPESGMDYYYWNFKSKIPNICYCWDAYHFDLTRLAIGSIRETKEECQAWGDEYHDAWQFKFNNL